MKIKYFKLFFIYVLAINSNNGLLIWWFWSLAVARCQFSFFIPTNTWEKQIWMLFSACNKTFKVKRIKYQHMNSVTLNYGKCTFIIQQETVLIGLETKFKGKNPRNSNLRRFDINLVLDIFQCKKNNEHA